MEPGTGRALSFMLSIFFQICSVLRPALETYFPEDSGVRVIAEPGRFFVASAFTLAVNVIAKRAVPRSGECHFCSLQDTESSARDKTGSSAEHLNFCRPAPQHAKVLFCVAMCGGDHKTPKKKRLRTSTLPFAADEKGAEAASDQHFMYYINDGVYGSFNCLLYDHAEVVPELLEVSADIHHLPS